MRPDGLTARGWVRCVQRLHWCELQHWPYSEEKWRARLERIEARARREAGKT